jgi:hypothetical protein
LGAAVPAAIYAPSELQGELRQGEIITDLIEVRLNLDAARNQQPARIDSITHPFAIVVTQDCELEQDYRARANNTTSDKLLPCVLLLQMTSCVALRGELQRQGLNTKLWKPIANNKNERYHVFEAILAEHDHAGAGLPALAVDFKRCFTVPTEEIYWRVEHEARRRCRLVSPYLEHLAARFGFFYSRVALPRDHEIVETEPRPPTKPSEDPNTNPRGSGRTDKGSELQ